MTNRGFARDLARAPAMRASVGALAAATALLIWTSAGAFRTDPLPPAPPASVVSVAAISRPASQPPADVQSAVDNDIFAADREAPSAPYRMPGDSVMSDKPVVEAVKPAVLGTAVATDGRSFATLQLGGDRPTLVHVGDKIGEWVVKAIQRGKVVLISSAGTRADVTVSKPGT